MRSNTTILAVAIGATALLGLAACSTDPGASGDGDSPTQTEESTVPDGPVYDFTQINGMEPATKITFIVPEEIVELETDYADNRVLSSVTAESVDFGSAEFCGIALTYEYASDDVVDRVLAKPMDTGGAGGFLMETPEGQFRVALGMEDGTLSIGKPPAKPSELGAYLSEDHSTLVVVRYCASSAFDDHMTVASTIRFNALSDATVGVDRSGEGVRTSPSKLEEDGFVPTEVGQADTAGSVMVNVMKNGDLNVIAGELTDYKLDANGDWIVF